MIVWSLEIVTGTIGGPVTGRIFVVKVVWSMRMMTGMALVLVTGRRFVETSSVITGTACKNVGEDATWLAIAMVPLQEAVQFPTTVRKDLSFLKAVATAPAALEGNISVLLLEHLPIFTVADVNRRMRMVSAMLPLLVRFIASVCGQRAILMHCDMLSATMLP